MKQNLFIHSLTLIGYRKNYSVEFKKGLNFITGPISTGKSSILEFINYALGSKDHKDYLEVKSSCTDVELIIEISNIKYKIVRPLFLFDRPFKLYTWNNSIQDFPESFDIFEVSSPKNENSLSNFLLSKLDVPEISISNQAFSFRDLFKYCYVNQSNIDSENLLNEKYYASDFKRKPTLEIILNSLNEILHELKELKKLKKEDLNKFHERKNAIVDFLSNVELNVKPESIIEEKNSLTSRKEQLLSDLNALKDSGKTKDDFTKSLEAQLFIYNRNINILRNNHQEILDYKNKLQLLRNQYNKELVKYDYLLMAQGKIQKIEFDSCPSCNSEIKSSDFGKCALCGNELTDLDSDEIAALKLEKKRLSSKTKELVEFIEKQDLEIEEISKEIETFIKKRAKSEEKLNAAQQ
ncbi:AAA family ATPase, partial [Candidatus Woesearchaeota archaeon]|nr:AAA family ATPase [Candidatus Woesearchaeota archaeon]